MEKNINFETLKNIENAVTNLQDNFYKYQTSHAQKMQKSLLNPYRPILGGDNNLDKTAFTQYIKSGQKALVSSEDGSGTFLIPHAVTDKISSYLKQTPCMRSVAKVTTINSSNLEILLDKNDGEAGWVAENGNREETKTPELQKIQIHVHEMYARPLVTQKILEDSNIDIEQWLSKKISEKFLAIENYGFINGNGVNQPNGFLSVPRAELGKGKGEKIEEISLKNGLINTDVLLEIIGSLKTEYLNGAVWMMSRGALNYIRSLKEKNSDRHLWQPSLSAEQPSNLLGFSVVVTDDMPAFIPSKSHTSIAFGNFYHGYQIVDRSEMNILRDPFSSKPYVEFYTTKRVGGAVVNYDAIKLINCKGE